MNDGVAIILKVKATTIAMVKVQYSNMRTFSQKKLPEECYGGCYGLYSYPWQYIDCLYTVYKYFSDVHYYHY